MYTHSLSTEDPSKFRVSAWGKGYARKARRVNIIIHSAVLAGVNHNSEQYLGSGSIKQHKSVIGEKKLLSAPTCYNYPNNCIASMA